MPSLWKKQKGNRISRLVSDFQTPPKRGGSLVVETGFPTSIVDLFVKNRDRLKKPSKRKYRASSKTTRENEDQPYLVSYPPVALSKLEVPCFSNDEKTQENGTHVENSGFCVEEIVGNNKSYDLCVDEIVSNDKDSSLLVEESSSDCCEYEDVGQAEGGDSRKAVSMSILKGGFAVVVVVVALYTRRFVVEITLGTLLLLLLEFVGKFVGFLRPCKEHDNDDDDRTLLGFSLGWMKAKQGKGKLVQNRILSRAIRIGAKGLEDGQSMVVFKGGDEDDVGNGVVLQWEVDNHATFARVIEDEDGIGIDSKGEIEQANSRAFLIEESPYLDEEGRSKPVCEIEALDPNVCVMTRNSYYDGPGGYCEFRSRKGTMRRGEKEDDGKMKKEKKFWKKFVLKRVQKRKKLKNGKDQREAGYDGELPTDCVDEITAELEEVVEQEEDEQEMADGEMSSSSLSSGKEEWEVRCFGAANDGYSTMLQIDNRNSKSCWLLMKQEVSLRYLIIMGIALTGLIQGKICALLLTVICCFIFKMMRS